MFFSERLAERYRVLKGAVPDCLLLMQVGAFMQVMDEDAREVAGVTGLKLQIAGAVEAPSRSLSQGKTGCLRGIPCSA